MPSPTKAKGGSPESKAATIKKTKVEEGNEEAARDDKGMAADPAGCSGSRPIYTEEDMKRLVSEAVQKFAADLQAGRVQLPALPPPPRRLCQSRWIR